MAKPGGSLLRLRRVSVAAWLGAAALAGVAVLLVWDLSPGLFPARAHDALAASPLAIVALACIVHEVGRAGASWVLARAVVVTLAFLFWALNQFWPDSPKATLYNDVAILGFVLDVFLVFVGRKEAPAAEEEDGVDVA